MRYGDTLHLTIGIVGNEFSEADRCKKCDGKQTAREKKVHEIEIDKGRKHGEKIVLRGAGDQKVRNQVRSVTCFVSYVSSYSQASSPVTLL